MRKELWHTNKEMPENGACVLWKAKIFSKELGNIEGGRYDKYYDCFCGTASLFVNRTNIEKWIYCKDVFDILGQNISLRFEIDKTIKQLKDYEKALKEYADGDFYEADINLLTNPLTNKEEVFSVDIQNKKGNVIYTKAQEVLKKWEIE